MRLAVLAGAVAIALVATAPAGGAQAARTVVLRDIAFSPEVVRVRQGDRVTWRWDDGPFVSHDLRSVGRPRFRGSSARRTGSHRVRFTKRGTYRYECTLHPGMTGRVVVR